MKRFLSVSVVIVLVLAIISYARPLPKVQAQSTLPALPASSKVSIPWPNYGQAAFGAVGFGVLATNGSQTSAPIASIAKTVTALSVLRKKPLTSGQQGPTITLDSSDVALYQKYLAENGSVVPVNNGEQITEYQALQAMLLPSANNIADSLANWAFGSQSAYLSYANNYVSSLGLSQTHVADGSGFSPNSVSSAHDLVILGETLLANPVLADIVSQSQADIPVAGTVNNVNWLLGSGGVNGIKTGNTDQAGGCFLFSAKRSVGNQQVEIVGAIMGAPDSSSPSQAIEASQNIIDGSNNNFQVVHAVKAGQSVGTYKAKWGVSSSVVAKSDLSVLIWNSTQPAAAVKLDKLSAPAAQGKTVGSITLKIGQKSQSVPVVLQQKIASPSAFWRIFHI